MRRLMSFIVLAMGIAALAGSVAAAIALIGTVQTYKTQPEDTYALAITLILGLVVGGVALVCRRFLKDAGATHFVSLTSASILAICLAAVLGSGAFIGFVDERSGDLKFLLLPAVVLTVSAYILWQDGKRDAS
jgi:hypothetical protein